MTDTDAGRSGMEELALRCEQASGPDRELNRVIFAIVRPECFEDAEEVKTYANPEYRGNNADWRYLRDIGLPAYTASLDAAIKLVPENHEWSVGWCGNSNATVNQLPDGPPIDGYAPTPALALCAAALRARAVLSDQPSPTEEDA